jgi:hypothetical protein
MFVMKVLQFLLSVNKIIAKKVLHHRPIPVFNSVGSLRTNNHIYKNNWSRISLSIRSHCSVHFDKIYNEIDNLIILETKTIISE